MSRTSYSIVGYANAACYMTTPGPLADMAPPSEWITEKRRVRPP